MKPSEDERPGEREFLESKPETGPKPPIQQACVFVTATTSTQQHTHMKQNRTTWLAAGASLLLAAFAPQAQSAQVVYTPGDLVLAFRASGGQGAANSLLVGIGPASSFTAGINSSIVNNLSLGDLGAELVAQYGATWFDRTDLTWSVFGANTGVNAVLYASRAQTTFGTDAVGWPVLADPTDRSTTRNNIQSVTNNFDTLDAATNSTVAALQLNGSGAEKYSQQVTGGSTDFSGVSQWTNIEGNFGVGSEALNLFRVTGTAGTTQNLGKFTISNAGQVTFNGTNVDIAAVPEPSKALFGMMGAGALFLRRRRPSAKASA